MRHTKFALALLSAAVLSACGGGSSEPGDQSLKTKFTQEVAFGDSLSDVGTYRVGTVAALKGGEFNINGDNTAISATLTGKNWTELMAAQLGLPAACAAYTGLDGDASPGFLGARHPARRLLHLRPGRLARDQSRRYRQQADRQCAGLADGAGRHPDPESLEPVRR